MARIDIKSDREFFREIYKKVEAGKYGIPSFQRDYVWTPPKIVDFFDSIWKGYPIGAVILWKPDAEMPTKDILTDKPQTGLSPEYYVLDGRQRLTTFYGCVQHKRESDRKFELYFNLETEQFSFKNKSSVLNLKVSDIYDTFELLMRLQEITRYFEGEPTLTKRYIERANKLNAILQGYTVSEIFIEDCSLDEAEEVFARINSKGTDITKEFKLQALTYTRGSRLVTEMISGIKQSLALYHFDTIKSDYIIDCLYKFIGKNYYDAKVEDLVHLDMEGWYDDIKNCICKSVCFLYEECHVLSEKILPYKNQLIALTWYFMQNKGFMDPVVCEALKKWFCYTTYAMTFNNSSLSNIRPVFNHFENYILGREAEPIKYMPVEMEKQLNYRFRLSDVHTDIVILAAIHRRMKQDDDGNLGYRGYIKIGSDMIADHIICISDKDRQLADSLFTKGETLGEDELHQLSLTAEMVEAHRAGHERLFRELRQQQMFSMISEWLEDNHVEVNQV